MDASVEWGRMSFQEAIAYLQNKTNTDTDTWRDVYGSQQDAAFAVAGAKGALLQDLRRAVDAAIIGGESLGDFRARFSQIIDAYGWNAGTNRDWRARLIYGQNVRTAYAAGRYAQMTDPDVADSRPYWQWRHGDSPRARPHHLALNGKVFRSDDLFWSTNYPPNGFGCRCRVITLSDRDLARRGIQPETAPLNGDQGEIEIDGKPVPFRYGPDKGFEYAPGASQAARIRREVLNGLPPRLQQEVLLESAGAVPGMPSTLGDLKASLGKQLGVSGKELNAAVKAAAGGGNLNAKATWQKAWQKLTAPQPAKPPLASAPQWLQDFSGQTASAKLENLLAVDANGKPILQKQGGMGHLEIKPAELKKLKGAEVIHNHPDGAALSDADWLTAGKGKLAKLHAVGGGWLYSIEPPAGGWPTATKLKKALKDAQKGLDPADPEYWHKVSTAAANTLGAKYARTTAPTPAPAPAPATPAPKPAKDWGKLTVAQLKAEAAKQGIKLPSKAKKADWVAALQNATATPAPAPAPATPAPKPAKSSAAVDAEWNALNTYNLKQLGSAMGLKLKGKKGDMIAALKNAGAQPQDWSKMVAASITKQSSAPVTSAPKPKPQQAPKVQDMTPVPPAQSLRGGDFPAAADAVEVVRQLGGSTGAELVRDPVTGKQYVRKRGNSPGHLLEEAQADAAYQALGVDVPAFRVYVDENGVPTKLSEYIPNARTLGDLSGAERAAAIAQLRNSFAADALLGNIDVLGMNEDNVLVDASGRVWRIDNGSSFRYRAQGGAKDRDWSPPASRSWNDYPTELWSLRDASVNKGTADVFGDIGHDELLSQIDGLLAARQRLLDSLPPQLQPTVQRRVEEMERMVDYSRTMRADKFAEDYVGLFARSSMELRAQGTIERLPKELRPASAFSTTLKDENGKEFDDLRGAGSRMYEFEAYLNAIGGDVNRLQSWMAAQGSNSWSDGAQALKYWIATRMRPGLDSETFWRFGIDDARDQYEWATQTTPEEEFAKTFAAWQAWNYEIFDSIDLPNADRSRKLVRLVRTEDLSVMNLYGVNRGDKQVSMLRGANESTSLVEPIEAYGTEVTYQDVPFHRIMGSYLYERSAGTSMDAFLGDNENEVVAMLDGLKFDYVGSIYKHDEPTAIANPMPGAPF